MFVFKAIHALALAYLSELITVHHPVSTLYSADHISLVVPRSIAKKFGDQTFAVHGPKL